MAVAKQFITPEDYLKFERLSETKSVLQDDGIARRADQRDQDLAVSHGGSPFFGKNPLRN